MSGGAYNVDLTLATMVRGLEKETAARLSGVSYTSQGAQPPSPPSLPMNKNKESFFW